MIILITIGVMQRLFFMPAVLLEAPMRRNKTWEFFRK